MTDSVEEFLSLKSEDKVVVPVYTPDNLNENWPHSPYAISDPDDITDRDLLRIFQRIKGVPWIISETPRLIIRETTVNDVEDFYRIYSAKSITEYIENLFEDPDEELCYTKKYIDTIYKFYNYGLWTLVLKETGKVIGRAGLSPREDCDYPDLGFIIEEKYQNKGLAYEACLEIIKYAFTELEMTTLQSRANPENIKSIGLLNKLGFKKTNNQPSSELVVYILNQ